MRCPCQPPGIKGLSSILNGCEQSRATFAKAEEEMNAAWAAHRLLRSIPGTCGDKTQAGHLCQKQDRSHSCGMARWAAGQWGLEKICKRGGGEGGFSSCSSQTDGKRTAGHPGVCQRDGLSPSLGHIETGLWQRGRAELSAWKWQLYLCWQQRGDPGLICVILQEGEEELMVLVTK